MLSAVAESKEKFVMTTYYLSPKSNYYIDEEKYYKNGAELKNEKDQPFTELMFKSAIRKENSAFIHRAYSNIIVLIGAGASEGARVVL